MALEQDRSGEPAQFEWVNAWAATPVNAAPVAAIKSAPVIAPITIPDDQLMRDIAEIERVRDRLAAVPIEGSVTSRRTQSFTFVSSRTSDSVPVVVGGVMALVMLTVFGAAAAMTKLAR